MKSYLKTKMVETNSFVDMATGEILETEIKKHSYIANSKEEFMLLYVSILPIFVEISGPAKSVYAYLLNSYDSETIFEIGGGTKSLMAKKIGIGLSTISNALTELKDRNLIYSTNKGMYQINPRYAFKGSSNNRNGALKAIIELGCKDC